MPNLPKTLLRFESRENTRLGDPTFVPMNNEREEKVVEQHN